MGILLLGIFLVSGFDSYRAIRESSLELAEERLSNLTQLFSNISQQSSISSLRNTATAADKPAIKDYFRSPSPVTQAAALATLQQFASPQDPGNLQVELWNGDHSLALTIPENASPIVSTLETEFKKSAVDPFQAAGALRIANDVVVSPAVASVKGAGGERIGYVVRWRKVSVNPAPKQLTELLGNDATVYFGNTEGDVWTNLTKVVRRPPVIIGSTSPVTQYTRDGVSVMAMGRPITGTPFSLVIEISDRVFVNEARRFLGRMALIGLVLLLVGIAGAFALSQTITRPLHSLTAAASAVSSGDYSQTVDVNYRDELGTLARAFNAMVVTTGEAQRELEVKVHERTLQLEAAPCAMLMINERGQITLVNTQMEQLFGYERSELLEQPIEMLVPERYRKGHPNQRQIFSARPTARVMGAGRDLYGRRKDGSEVPIEIGLNPIQTDSGRFVLASIIDITERKQAQERFRLVVEAAPSAMLMVNKEGLITLVNKQVETLFSYTREELIGQPIELLVPERYRSAHPGRRKLFAVHPSARSMSAGRDLFGRRKDGSEVPIEIGLNPIETDEGAFVLASIIDITERKAGEISLRDSEQRLNTVIENLTEGLVIADLDGQLLHWNKAALKMHGFASMDECLLKLPEFANIIELSTIDGSILPLEDWPLSRVIRDGNLRDLEIRIRRLDCDWQRVLNYGGSIVNEGPGRQVAFVTIGDITERKLAAENLRRSQEQLSGVIGSAMDAIISVDEEQRIVLFNAAAEKMFLYPAEDAIGQPLDRFIPERFRHTHKNHVADFGNTHVTRRSMGTLGALYGLRADGEEFPIEASISQIESQGRKIFTVILRDITERKRSEEALNEQARILDLAPVMIRDLNGGISFWNTGVEKMFGWTKEEAVGKISHKLLHTEFPQPLNQIKAKLYARGHWEGETVHLRKDGQRIVVASQWALHRDAQDKPKAVVVVNNDITDRKQAEKEIRRLNEELEQRVADRTAQLEAANKELEAFSYSVSHDLRAPLRHIDGFSQALLEDYTDKLDDEGQNYLREVRGATQEMAQLIEDLLQLARVTRTEMRREIVDLSATARAVVAELQSREPQRVVTIKIEDGLAGRCDKRLLKVVLVNLLGNAWKFTSKQLNAEIEFGHEENNGGSSFFVRDNGAGFDMSYVGKLFGAFQRLHTAGEFQGTGIGLATVQRIVYRHGGRVWAEAAVNQGATFYFTLVNSREHKDGQQSDLIS
jgi:PAS domain S-box-containing protein